MDTSGYVREDFHMADVGKAIRARREALGFTQDQLAEMVQVASATIRVWEKSPAMKIHGFNKSRLLRALRCTEPELLGDEPMRPVEELNEPRFSIAGTVIDREVAAHPDADTEEGTREDVYSAAKLLHGDYLESLKGVALNLLQKQLAGEPITGKRREAASSKARYDRPGQAKKRK